ncbi:hypothetical protein PoB_006270600 [Plakobranchus ocellatus]|uniref:Secreted protein n=1 Tax=Plakobranchus ocellatus TaxID=259542 RepID=A0AAV4CWG2_9GAST|nr:hypothetical protein PoB_006270600 [Plakobranchus ocellatus]
MVFCYKLEAIASLQVCFLHRACAMEVRRHAQFCDDSLYDDMRNNLQTIRRVKSRTQSVWRLRALARGWWTSCCICLAISSFCKSNKK